MHLLPSMLANGRASGTVGVSIRLQPCLSAESHVNTEARGKHHGWRKIMKASKIRKNDFSFTTLESRHREVN